MLTKKTPLAMNVVDTIRRHPAMLAQTAITIDHLSGGRFILGLGSGELENTVPYGFDFSKPVSRFEESLNIIKLLWESEAPYDKLGWNISDTHGLSFAGCRVPEENLLGQRGHGFRQFLKTLDDGRIAISALALGMIRRMLDESVAYSKTRTAFGKPIGINQGVAFPIADLAVMAETSRLLTYRAAWLKDEQEAGRRSVADVKQAAAVAKLYTSEAAVTATRIATQVFGGNGFMEEYPVARFYRDAKILEIGEGTSEVQRMVIAKSLGLPS